MKIHLASERQNLTPIGLRKTSMKFSLLNPDRRLLRDIVARVVAVLSIKYSLPAAQVTGIEAFSSSPLKGTEGSVGKLFNQPYYLFQKVFIGQPLTLCSLFSHCTKNAYFHD